ncbi:hypothetical protein ACQWF5_24870, partial [Salmonella enterica subsp. enterica serovar Infantis]
MGEYKHKCCSTGKFRAVIQDIIAALWQHDFAALANP